MNKKVFFLSSLLPHDTNYFVDNSLGAMSNANTNLQEALVKGFLENDYLVHLVNVPNIGAFPKRFKKLNIEAFDLQNESSGIEGKSLSFLNMNIIKHLFAYFSLKKYFKKIKSSEIEYLFVYDLYPPFFKIIEFLKKNNNNLKVVLMIPDILGMTRDNTNPLHKILDQVNLKIINSNIKYIDGFVYLTTSMVEQMPIDVRAKQSIVVEGILNEVSCMDMSKNELGKYILYTGSLDVRHGILELVEAYVRASLTDIKLVVCGDGAGKDIFLERIQSCSSIVYLGQVEREQILYYQQNAMLLVNPRGSKEEFTKYSFPSKIMEYFNSGVPTFMYRLDGIPDEYYDYCFWESDESIDCLTRTLVDISQKGEEEMKLMGSRAKEFVRNEKNSQKQVKRIIHLFERV